MKVKSDSNDRMYEVTPHSCTCADYIYRQAKVGGRCKHMIKAFYTDTSVDDKNMREFFKDGVSIDDAYNRYEDKIDLWLKTGEICKHRGKFVLLE